MPIILIPYSDFDLSVSDSNRPKKYVNENDLGVFDRFWPISSLPRGVAQLILDSR
jgi:hypothetical protein